jgi:hypothetical protein
MFPLFVRDARQFVIFWNSVLKTGFPEVEFECPRRSARSGFRQPRCPCCLALFRSAYSGSFRFCSHHSSLKRSYSVQVEFERPRRSARSGFHQPRCLCCLALFRSAYSGSFRFCSHHSSLKRSYSVQVEFERPRRSARSGFRRRIVPRPAQHSWP